MALPVFFDGLSSIASSSDNMISRATGCELAKTRTLPTQFWKFVAIILTGLSIPRMRPNSAFTLKERKMDTLKLLPHIGKSLDCNLFFVLCDMNKVAWDDILNVSFEVHNSTYVINVCEGAVKWANTLMNLI